MSVRFVQHGEYIDLCQRESIKQFVDVGGRVKVEEMPDGCVKMVLTAFAESDRFALKANRMLDLIHCGSLATFVDEMAIEMKNKQIAYNEETLRG